MDLTFPNSSAHHPPIGTCIWRAYGNVFATMCGQPIAARHSRVCVNHLLAWQFATPPTRKSLKAAADTDPGRAV